MALDGQSISRPEWFALAPAHPSSATGWSGSAPLRRLQVNPYALLTAEDDLTPPPTVSRAAISVGAISTPQTWIWSPLASPGVVRARAGWWGTSRMCPFTFWARTTIQNKVSHGSARSVRRSPSGTVPARSWSHSGMNLWGDLCHFVHTHHPTACSLPICLRRHTQGVLR
jgi:hypothetical protein